MSIVGDMIRSKADGWSIPTELVARHAFPLNAECGQLLYKLRPQDQERFYDALLDLKERINRILEARRAVKNSNKPGSKANWGAGAPRGF